MYTLEIIENLVSGFLLNKAWFIQFIGVDLYIIIKNDIFVKLLCLRLLRIEIEIQFSNKIKRTRSDKGTEYYFSLFNEFYK